MVERKKKQNRADGYLVAQIPGINDGMHTCCLAPHPLVFEFFLSDGDERSVR